MLKMLSFFSSPFPLQFLFLHLRTSQKIDGTGGHKVTWKKLDKEGPRQILHVLSHMWKQKVNLNAEYWLIEDRKEGRRNWEIKGQWVQKCKK